MDCTLLHLPTELQLLIIKNLLRGDIIDPELEEDPYPIEVYHDLINWSCTCSYYRSLLAPDVFKTCKLTNHKKSGSSLNAVANSPHKIHVKNLYFIGSISGNAYVDDAVPSDTEAVLPSNVDALLRDLQRFPNLEKLSIYFGHTYWKTALPSVAETETQEQVLKAESTSAWRALMFRTYSALTHNKSPNFKHLEITKNNWMSVSAFSHTSFHDFLGQFEQFTLSIVGDNRFERRDPLLPEMLDKYFYSHLAKVSALNINGREHNPSGLEWSYARNPPPPDRMPLLTTLQLDCIFATPRLVDFLISHKDTLEEVTLRDCCATLDFDDDLKGGIYWSELFTPLLSARPTQLRRFDLVGDNMLFPTEKLFYEEGREKVLDMLQQDPARMFFPYATLQSPWVMMFHDIRDSLDEVLRGEDQKSWDGLMGLVNKNAKDAKKRLAAEGSVVN